ncbi:cytochrome b/b6 domain-containing protein [Flexistipes sinusarabici]|nr:cytochrome b/b6 domain-containing protein [Flexistipes sinusarabici]
MKIQNNNTVTVYRHDLLYRILHWAIVLEVLILFISGLGVSDYLPLTFISRGAARNLHVAVSMVWLGTVIFFIYYFIISGEYKWFSLSRLGESFDFLIEEVRGFILGKKMKSPVIYDKNKKRYIEKIVPTEILAWWGWFVLWIIMILTGLALFYPDNLMPVIMLSKALVPSAANAEVATRIVHLIVSLIFIVYIFIHAFASLSFGMVGSMITGVKKEVTVNSEKV